MKIIIGFLKTIKKRLNQGINICLFVTTLVLLLFTSSIVNSQNYCNSNPVDVHGNLSVNGNKIVDKNNEIVSFAGNSHFWSNTGWGAEKYYNAGVVNWLKNDWNTTIVRAAMGIEGNGGYLVDPTANKNRVKALVDAAIAAGLYVVIDWHDHHAENNQAQAISFFQEMAQLYGASPNVIYEIYNEPLQVSWSNTIKPYAEAVISAIRAIDPDNLIIVGTPTWSQDVDQAANDPITSSTNIAYTLHFYAATHKGSLIQKAQSALNNGIALMVTEWGTVEASGDGAVDGASTDAWMSFLASSDISHMNWSIHDKVEGASALNPGAGANGNWSANNLTASGTKVKSIIKNWKEYCSGGTSNQPPTVSISSPANNSVFTGGTVQITASASDSDGTVSQVEFFANGNSVGVDNSAPYSFNWNPTDGSYSLSAKVTDNDGADTTSSLISVTIGDGGGNSSAYPSGVPHTIAGRLDPTNFDIGGQGIAYNDSDNFNEGDGPRANEGVDTGNGSIGWITSGEWLNYTVDVKQTGRYDISYEVASLPGGGVFHLEFNGNDVTGPINVAETGGWGSFLLIRSENIQLTAGEQTMRIVMDQGPFNLGELIFTLVTGGNTNIPPSVSISSPSNNSTFTDGTVQITANASDSDGGVSQVEFFTNGSSVGIDNSAPYSVNWNATNGSYTLTAKATDNDGDTTTSAFITVTIGSTGDNCGSIAIWSLSAVYANAGTQVAYNGNIYQNNWYTSGQNPETNSGQWQPWTLIGSCSRSTINKDSVTQKTAAFEVRAFPNPYTEAITLIANNTEQEIDSVQLLDLSGKIIIQKSVKSNMITLKNLDLLANGIYLIKIFNSKEHTVNIVKVFKD